MLSQWSDTPIELQRPPATTICHFSMEIGDHLYGIQVMESSLGITITTGNLFGSETLKAKSYKDVLKAISVLHEGKKKSYVPEELGLKLIPNSKPRRNDKTEEFSNDE
jgi:hypothetical protein